MSKANSDSARPPLQMQSMVTELENEGDISLTSSPMTNEPDSSDRRAQRGTEKMSSAMLEDEGESQTELDMDAATEEEEQQNAEDLDEEPPSSMLEDNDTSQVDFDKDSTDPKRLQPQGEELKEDMGSTIREDSEEPLGGLDMGSASEEDNGVPIDEFYDDDSNMTMGGSTEDISDNYHDETELRVSDDIEALQAVSAADFMDSTIDDFPEDAPNGNNADDRANSYSNEVEFTTQPDMNDDQSDSIDSDSFFDDETVPKKKKTKGLGVFKITGLSFAGLFLAAGVFSYFYPLPDEPPSSPEQAEVIAKPVVQKQVETTIVSVEHENAIIPVTSEVVQVDVVAESNVDEDQNVDGVANVTLENPTKIQSRQTLQVEDPQSGQQVERDTKVAANKSKEGDIGQEFEVTLADHQPEKAKTKEVRVLADTALLEEIGKLREEREQNQQHISRVEKEQSGQKNLIAQLQKDLQLLRGQIAKKPVKADQDKPPVREKIKKAASKVTKPKPKPAKKEKARWIILAMGQGGASLRQLNTSNIIVVSNGDYLEDCGTVRINHKAKTLSTPDCGVIKTYY